MYPHGLGRPVLKGVSDQLRADIRVADDEHEALKSIYGPEQSYSGKYNNDLTGQLLKDEPAMKARRMELEYVNSKGVWRKVPRQTS